MRPHRRQPTRLLSLGFSPPEYWSGLPFPSPMRESEVTQSCLTLCDPMDYTAYQAPPSMGFIRQEYWSGLPLPSLIQRFPCHCILASTVSLVFLMIAIPTCLRWYLNVPLTSLCISLRINTVDHIFTYLLDICVPLLYYLKPKMQNIDSRKAKK